MNKKEHEGILRAVILLERNNHLSAHREGLIERQRNRKAAIEILRGLVGLVGLSEATLEDIVFAIFNDSIANIDDERSDRYDGA